MFFRENGKFFVLSVSVQPPWGIHTQKGHFPCRAFFVLSDSADKQLHTSVQPVLYHKGQRNITARTCFLDLIADYCELE